jgi:tRNA nucleotidyltransferase/poly(A) polymerase
VKKLNIVKKISQFLLLTVLILIFCAIAFSQNNKELNNYKFRTLSEVTMLNREASDEILRKSKLEEKHDFISFDLFYSRVRAQFTGNSRPISSDHKDLIKTWEKLQNVDRKLTSLYENEFLFVECGKEYWIPMQKKVSEAITKEAKTNDMITLCRSRWWKESSNGKRI